MYDKVTCIICPKSCVIEVKKNGNEIITMGEGCSRGKKYAVSEIADPRRIFTSTVLVNGSDGLRVVPVRTTKPIKKNDWAYANKMIDKLRPDVPVEFGEIVASDFLEKGINLITTREVMKDNSEM